MRRITFCLIMALCALLTLGTLHARDRFLLRGVPDALPEPIAHSELRLGINVELEQYSDAELEETLATIARTDYQVLKQSFYFGDDVYSAETQRIIEAVTRHNLKLVPLLDGNPDTQFARPKTDEFSEWAADFATAYGDVIDYYIIWDEPNLASHWGGRKVNADSYAALLNMTGAAIRAVDATAFIVAAPLAPTTETESINLSDLQYLQQLYESGAQFDVAAAKPYGFDSSPSDRTTRPRTLNFNRAILLREVMERNGDSGTALWAGNWGWNALPPDWSGDDSIWGDTTQADQLKYTISALRRAQQEWPWMGTMFIENWEPNAEPDDPIWGFSVARAPIAGVLLPDDAAYSGFYLAQENEPHANWDGDWDFSAEFGADSSEKYIENGDIRDRVTFDFYGTDIGLRVRRADFRSRFYVTIDGQPANLRPSDEFGTTVVLDAPNPNEDYLTVEPVAGNLEPGRHRLEVIAHRGWSQWALNGFSVGYQPPTTPLFVSVGLWAIALGSLMMAVRSNSQLESGSTQRWWNTSQARFAKLNQWTQLATVTLLSLAVALTGWQIWGSGALGLYRRLGDGQQLALTVGTAAIFFVTPWFVVYLIALVLLTLLISFRPIYGLALIAISIPFYGRAHMILPLFGDTGLYKTIFDRFVFSPTEIFTWVVLAAVLFRWLVNRDRTARLQLPQLSRIDWAVVTFVAVATLSLAFTERRDVAFNEWRWVILEPALFYALIRHIKPSRQGWWLILDCFVISGVIVALYGLAQIVFGFQDLITAEFGLKRIQSIYGSPNNVALYFGRILPLLLAIVLFSNSSLRRWLYLLAALLLGLTFILTISKGGILVALPIACLILLAYWLRQQGRTVWPYIAGCLLLGLIGLTALLQIPQLAGRLDLLGETSFVRVNLWRASLEIIREHPWFGVGMDNFLYAHRGRYILEAQWREPNLNHPHNIILDYATRLGLLGLIAGGWVWAEFGRSLATIRSADPTTRPLHIGLIATFGYMLAHGLVDHSFFLIDLAFSFFLLLGLAQSLHNMRESA